VGELSSMDRRLPFLMNVALFVLMGIILLWERE